MSLNVDCKIRLSSQVFTLLFVFLICSCASLSTQNGARKCPNLNSTKIKNFHVVKENVLWRGERPNKDGMECLIEQGVQTIVNLELFFDDKPTFAQAKVSENKKYEVEYFRIRIKETFVLVPSYADNQVAHFLAIVDQAPKPVYVHCLSGENRTGVMVAAYKIFRQSVSVEQAISDMETYGGVWRKADKEYIRHLPQRSKKIEKKVAKWKKELKKDAQIICENGTCTF
jgi:protein tyrosine/serine phosphatase